MIMKDGRPYTSEYCFNHTVADKNLYGVMVPRRDKYNQLKIVTETTGRGKNKIVRKLAWCPGCKIQFELKQ